DAHTPLVLLAENALALRHARRRVEVAVSVGRKDVVDEYRLGTRPLQLRVIPPELVLSAAQRHLAEQLLQLRAVLLDLRRCLPVHVALLALGALELLLGLLTQNLGLARTVRRKELLDRAAGKVDAALRQHRVHRARRAVELGATRGFATHA